MKKTKIDWCDCTVNPVVGCKNNCPYCYARKLNDRFRFVEKWERPEFFPEKLKAFKTKKAKSVFINSMSDIGGWQEEWIIQTFKAMAANPQHSYIALTKYNMGILLQATYTYMRKNNENFRLYIGQSVTNQAQADRVDYLNEYGDFLSIEPLLEPINITRAVKRVGAVIIGAETGNRQDKVIPQKAWVDELVKAADKAQAAVFMKESLRAIMGADFRQDRLPWEVKNGKRDI